MYYYRNHSAASLLSPDDLDENYLQSAKYLHLTGITPALSESCKETVDEAIKPARKHEKTIIFDPNIRLKLWSKEKARQVLMEIAGQVDSVLPGIEEGELLTGSSDLEKIAKVFLNQGAKVVVVKLGSEGAYFATESERAYVSGFQVGEVVDTDGSGDGFAAGFISGLLRGWGYAKAVKFGNRIGAYALSVEGDMEGYLFWGQVNPDQSQRIISR
ncbi:sugar kinase [Bacillus swezeyi]|uniref:sugar kinase n=1 Tax=Bacillus swezeyi TaxID=1925020 RepID=UPI0023D92801|nr:sugar kinase [Bacillus swezeyi]MEC1262974.1 sugar kinase [Bacillus swezeyi]MED2929995.1 sugar kinase [Bacillus swezeyi]MED2963114.1 sugar kinase [Bacillus swezeyi]MED3074322.1 sugar kinase [Bacillus swezeyi]MED3084511.1 sugar kinase [Bacillus swezeyi]